MKRHISGCHLILWANRKTKSVLWNISRHRRSVILDYNFSNWIYRYCKSRKRKKNTRRLLTHSYKVLNSFWITKLMRITSLVFNKVIRLIKKKSNKTNKVLICVTAYFFNLEFLQFLNNNSGKNNRDPLSDPVCVCEHLWKYTTWENEIFTKKLSSQKVVST